MKQITASLSPNASLVTRRRLSSSGAIVHGLASKSPAAARKKAAIASASSPGAR